MLVTIRAKALAAYLEKCPHIGDRASEVLPWVPQLEGFRLSRTAGLSLSCVCMCVCVRATPVPKGVSEEACHIIISSQGSVALASQHTERSCACKCRSVLCTCLRISQWAPRGAGII